MAGEAPDRVVATRKVMAALLWLTSSIMLFSGALSLTIVCGRQAGNAAVVTMCIHGGPCKPCCGGLKCAGHQKCCNGWCKDVECCAHEDCPLDSACFQGRCKLLPAKPGGCGFGKVCCSRDDDCAPSLKCSGGGICQRGSRFEWPCGRDAECGDPGQRCCNGTCKVTQRCGDESCTKLNGNVGYSSVRWEWPSPCPAGQKRCSGGGGDGGNWQCRNCCTGIDCGADKECVGGKCLPRWRCPAGKKLCSNGKCQKCCADQDCAGKGKAKCCNGVCKNCCCDNDCRKRTMFYARCCSGECKRQC
ncbi:hypothetical protein CBR_g32268 [Chara braunii]|uniref:Uncharacterized protein n=1 Tax=Chara braunii TaxID=69332 RepID=A0A388JNG8_CHABU|nr:hypothetical protein CBR_g32268 [Chara braunii]|eukprot:GBG59252.1 hypothetical protein CBR_g32268 [Chara braunii]